MTEALRASVGRAYALGDAPWVPCGGRVARVGARAVKLYSTAERGRARWEARLLRHLEGGAGYRVQALVATVDGEDVLEHPDGSVLVTRWEDGASRDYTEITRPGWEALGRTLAALHRRLDKGIEAPEDLRLGPRLRALDPEAERRVLERHLGEARGRNSPVAVALLEARSALLEAHGARARDRFPTGSDARPGHNDYNQHNYLFPARGGVLILDWERALGVPREYEVVRSLHHLPWAAPARARRFWDAYRAVRSLDPQRLPWALDAALTEHATKHWPVEKWLRGDPGSAERLAALAPVVTALKAHTDTLRRFYEW
ncbi:MAG: phosphotransferase [Deltaproteobacteria bacterium]|nr:phosphotransferase [Deltaproteobacteria bacterium]